MTHLSDDDLVRLSATGLPTDARAHLEQCPSCRVAWERHDAVWKLLGERGAAGGGGSILDALMARAAREAQAPSSTHAPVAAQLPRALRTRARFQPAVVQPAMVQPAMVQPAMVQPAMFLRLAAALAIGVGAGLTLDRVLGRHNGEAGPSVDGGSVARETLLLPEFQNASPGSFAAAVLRVHPPAAPKAGPTKKGQPR